MLYTPAWNGFVEGPTWGAWWIQNSYGTTYCALPLLQEPHVTFLQNAQDLWFSQMGDGQRAGANNWVAPDGASATRHPRVGFTTSRVTVGSTSTTGAWNSRRQDC